MKTLEDHGNIFEGIDLKGDLIALKQMKELKKLFREFRIDENNEYKSQRDKLLNQIIEIVREPTN